MNWLTDYVRPKIKALVRSNRPDVPENLWINCPSCEKMIFHRDLEANQRVCPDCGHHCRVEGLPAVIAVINFDFMAGSMGCALGEGLLTAARLAVLQEAAFVVVTASGGARMQEGALSLMQMPRTTIAVEEVKEVGLPYITILTDPTTGGVTASFAMLGDIAIAEPGAQIGFAGRRVIEQTIRESLPEDFQKAEYLLEHGMIDMVLHRFELRATLARVIRLLMRPRLDGEAADAAERLLAD